MIIFLLVLFLLVIIGIRIGDYSGQYLDREQTTSIKGIFIVIVFLNHAKSYLVIGNSIFDTIYSMFFHLIGQMMVVMFSFYSGFGITSQFFSKGKVYVHSFLKKRVFLTWIHFALAVCLYALLAIILKTPYSKNEWLLCWIGWESIGNSNWFIFDIIFLYLASYVAMKIYNSTKNIVFFEIVNIGLTLLLWAFLYLTKNPSRYWYNTLLAYPFGILYYCNKEKIECIIKNKSYYFALLFISILSFAALNFIRNSVGENLASIMFVNIIVLITYRVKIGNKITLWLGENLFPIFILQRIPMIVLEKTNIHPILFVLFAFVITLILLVPFKYVCKKTDKYILKY